MEICHSGWLLQGKSSNSHVLSFVAAPRLLSGSCFVLSNLSETKNSTTPCSPFALTAHAACCTWPDVPSGAVWWSRVKEEQHCSLCRQVLRTTYYWHQRAYCIDPGTYQDGVHDMSGQTELPAPTARFLQHSVEGREGNQKCRQRDGKLRLVCWNRYAGEIYQKDKQRITHGTNDITFL